MGASPNSSIELVPVSSLPVSSIVTLLNEAFSDYLIPIKETVEEFTTRAWYNDISLDDSLVAQVDGEPAGLALLGIRGKEAWLGGMGLKKEHRGRGAGKALVKGILENAKARGASSLFLEVIVGNEPAYNMYRSFGFKETRMLSCYHKSDWATHGIEDATFRPVEFFELEDQYDKEHCWQKTFSSLKGVKNLECYRIEQGSEKGYIVLARGKKRAELGNDHAERGKKRAELGNDHAERGKDRVELVDLKPAKALTTALSMFTSEKEDIKAINIHDQALKDAFSQAGFTEFTRQREMRLAL